MRVDPAIWLTKSLTPAVICPVRFSVPSDSAMFFGGRFGSPATGMLPRLALLKIETVTWLSRKNRWTYFARWNSLPVFGVWPSNGFHGVQALPSSSRAPAALFGFRRNPAAVEADPGPWAMARRDRPWV